MFQLIVRIGGVNEHGKTDGTPLGERFRAARKVQYGKPVIGTDRKSVV
jgi:hypothetical protein